MKDSQEIYVSTDVESGGPIPGLNSMLSFGSAAYLAEPRPVMEGFDYTQPNAENRLVWWKSQRGTNESYVLALADFSYVVVVADRGDYVLPWTAYCVEQQHRQQKLRKEYEVYWKAQKS